MTGISAKPAGQSHLPLVTVPPSQTTLSLALPTGAIMARQFPLAGSEWVLAGHTHCPEASVLPPAHCVEAAGGAVVLDGAETAGGTETTGGRADFATQAPSLNSCQGKHFPSSGTHTPSFSTSPERQVGTSACSDCAIAAFGLKTNQQIKMTAAAEKRVMINPFAKRKIENSRNPCGFAIDATVAI
ncbi:MAG TPA: hypothetical protein VN926_06685 [Bradyrhizobium sp.]|nr:hypothetical protein [Bradyrhizobium sp.]